jgi:hypothetical protein
MASSFMKFLDHTQTHHTRLDSSERVISTSQRPLPDNTQHSRQTSMPPVGFETAIPAGQRPQTHALGRAATGTGSLTVTSISKRIRSPWCSTNNIQHGPTTFTFQPAVMRLSSKKKKQECLRSDSTSGLPSAASKPLAPHFPKIQLVLVYVLNRSLSVLF